VVDTIEKYLFESNYESPYKVISFEGIIDSCLFLILFLVNGCPLEITKKDQNTISYFIFIVLLSLYFILSGLKSIYRVTTIKLYSPMTRALTECVSDPIITEYFILKYYKKENNFWFFCIITTASLFIISFCSLVYNDFIILYCCNLEKNTYTEITKRSLPISNYFDEEEDVNINPFDDDDDDDDKNAPKIDNTIIIQ
jgi:hypothetical protein